MILALYFGILLGILVFTFFIHIQIAGRTGWPRHEVFFLGTVVAIFGYALLTWIEYGTVSVETYFNLVRIQAFCMPLFFICLVEFSAGYAKRKIGVAERIYEMLLAAFPIVRLFLPYTGLYSSVRGMATTALPFGQSVYLIDGEATVFILMSTVLIGGGIFFTVRSIARMRAGGEKRIAGFLLAAIVILAAAILNDVAISAGFYHGFYLVETAYVALAVVMSLGLTGEVINFSAVEKALQKSLADQGLLIREINHRVKNNLAVLSSLIRLQLGGEKDEHTKNRLGIVMNRIQSIASAHELAYGPAGTSGIDLKNFLDRLLQSALDTFGGTNIRTETVLPAEGILLSVDTAIPFGLICNEIFANSILHAWTVETDKKIRCTASRTRRDAAAWLVLTIGDNGRGWSVGSAGRGLGCQLIDALATQLGAQVRREDAGGTVWTLTLKLPETR